MEKMLRVRGLVYSVPTPRAEYASFQIPKRPLASEADDSHIAKHARHSFPLLVKLMPYPLRLVMLHS